MEARDLLRAHTSIRNYDQIILPVIFLRQLQYIADRSTKVFQNKTTFNCLFEKRDEINFHHILSEALHFLELDNDCLSDAFYATIFHLHSNEWANRPVLAKIFEIFLDIPENITFINSETSFSEDVFFNAIQITAEQEKQGEEHFTPIDLSILLAQILSPVGGDRIYDPACGSGTLLLACAKEVSKNSAIPPYLNGVEKNSSTWALAKINLFLHGFRNASISQFDVLRTYSHQEEFDIAVSCPPWSMKNWGHKEFSQRASRQNFYVDLPPKSSADYAFILEILDKLSNNGRAAIILPTGALSRSGAEMQIRKELIAMNRIDAVISLPEKSFHHSNIAPSILILNMQRKTREVFFINAKEKKNFEILSITYKNKQEIDNYSRFVTLVEIESNNYDLGVLNYLRPPAEHTEIFSPRVLRQQRIELNNQLENINHTIDQDIQDIIENFEI